MEKRINQLLDNSDIGGSPGEINVSTSNIDDIFRAFIRKNIVDVLVSKNEMEIIAQFVIANCTNCLDGMDYGEINPKALKIIKENKVDKFFGVKLKLKKG